MGLCMCVCVCGFCLFDGFRSEIAGHAWEGGADEMGVEWEGRVAYLKAESGEIWRDGQ